MSYTHTVIFLVRIGCNVQLFLNKANLFLLNRLFLFDKSLFIKMQDQPGKMQVYKESDTSTHNVVKHNTSSLKLRVVLASLERIFSPITSANFAHR